MVCLPLRSSQSAGGASSVDTHTDGTVMSAK